MAPLYKPTLVLVAVVLACFLAVAHGRPTASDVCVFQAGQWTSYDSVMQCIYSVPVNNAVKNQTIDALKKALMLYTFLDISRDSPDPQLPCHVDMLSALDYILKWPHKFDYSFHDDLRALFLLLGDAHTQYYAPTCYTTFTAQQPFAPISVTANGTNEQIIVVSEYFPTSLINYYQQTMNIDIRSFSGAQIVSIDGYNALPYLIEYANSSVGMSKDLGSRFNYALTRPNPRPGTTQVSYGYWQSRTRRNPFPAKPVVDYVLFANGKSTQISFPWAIQCTKNYTGLSSFMADYWAPNSTATAASSSSASSSSSARLDSPVVDKDENLMPSPVRASPSRAARSVAAVNETFTLLVNSTDLTFWQLSDNKTLVMYLDTFGPANMTETYLALNKGFEIAATNKLSRLIIDLSNNGGGSICFGRSLIAYLQQTENGTNYGPEDIITSPLQRNLTLSSVALNVVDTVWSPAIYANFTNAPIAQNDTSYLIPGVPHIRGGVPRNYSRLVHLNDCGNFGYRIKPAKNFTASQILILTNGFCGSTCALFSNHLANYDNVKTVVYGGINGRDQQYTAFPGGQVLDSAGFYEDLNRLGQNTAPGIAAPGEICPRQLPTSAAYRFCVREIYPPGRKYSAKPSEFTFAQSSHQVPYTYLTANAPQYAWYEVLPFFPAE